MRLRISHRHLLICITASLAGWAIQACTDDDSPSPEQGIPDANFPITSPDATTADGSHVVESGSDSTIAPLDVAVDTSIEANEGVDAAEDATEAASEDAAETLDAGNADASDAADAVVVADDADAADAPPPPGALLFDGVNDHLTVSMPEGGVSETAFTIELWFKTTNTTTTFFEVTSSGGGADRFLFLSAGKVCFYTYGPALTVCSTTATYADGTWHHAAGTVGPLGQQVFVDGALAGSDSNRTASTFATDNIVFVGYGHTGFFSATNYYKGKLDEVRLWRVQRAASEIAASYNQHIDPGTANLQAYWKLDETGATATATDETATYPAPLINFTFTPSPWQGPGAF
jgi:hypothetical protein